MENKIVEKNKGGRPKKITEQKFRLAVKDSNGNKSMIAYRLNCNWFTVNNYVKNNPFAQELLKQESEVVLDMAESVVVTAIQNGDVDMAWRYLNVKGKSRGYGNSVGVQVESNQNERTEIDVSTREMIERIKADSMATPVIPEHIQPMTPLNNAED